MSQSNQSSKTVGEYVAEDFRTARVFERYGIDFCCGGNVALSEICREKGIEPAAVLSEMESVKSTPLSRSENYGGWDLSFLIDYIVNQHHVYLKENLRPIASYAKKIAKVHGPHHPETIEIAKIFEKVAIDMEAHLREEEEVFFPAVKRIEGAVKEGRGADARDLEILKQALGKLGEEHEEVGEAVHSIRRLSGDYAIPGDVCNTFMLTYHKLKEFEDDLHKHVHLENNILFPKAAKL